MIAPGGSGIQLTPSFEPRVLAEQPVFFGALAEGTTSYIVLPPSPDHLVKKVTGPVCLRHLALRNVRLDQITQLRATASATATDTRTVEGNSVPLASRKRYDV